MKPEIQEIVGNLGCVDSKKSWLSAAGIAAAHLVALLITIFGALIDSAPLALNIVSSILHGVVIALIFAIAHDANHGSFVSSPVWNRWIARIAFVPHMHASSLWTVGHNVRHHGRTNLVTIDYPWAPLSKAKYDEFSFWRRWLERRFRGGVGQIIYYPLRVWLPKILLPIAPETRAQWRQHFFDSVFAIGGWSLMVGGILTTGRALSPDRPVWIIVVLGVILPLIVWNTFVGIVTYLQHTHPAIRWFDDEKEWTPYAGVIQGTAHIDVPGSLLYLLRKIMAHTAHHLLPQVPIYKLPEAQEKLLVLCGSDIVRYRFTIKGYRATLRACKLFDFERACWTDFGGNPTSPELRVATNGCSPSKSSETDSRISDVVPQSTTISP